MNDDRLIPTNGTPSVVTSIIRINGDDIPRTYQVLTMVVVKEINRISFAKIIIKDGDPAQEDFPVSNDELFTPGNEIEVLVGYQANENVIFKGVIVKQGIKIRQNGSSMLKLDCRDKAFKTTLVPRNRYFNEVKDSEAIEEILSDYDLGTEISTSEVTHQELVQYETTDWDFILARSESNSFLCLVDDGELSVQEPNFDQDPVLTATYGASVLEFDGEIDARKQYASVKASSWDHTNQELLEVDAAEPEIEEGGNLKASDLASTGDDPELVLRHSGHLLQDELQTRADAQLLQIRLAKIQGRVKFQGSPVVKPNTLITLKGFGDRFNGLVFVSGVRQEIQNGTWHTDVQFGLPEKWEIGKKKTNVSLGTYRNQINIGLQIGVVTQLQDDPDGEHRILVKLPIIDNDADGVWARIATLDAGENRGTFFLPEIEDEVVVGFLNNDSHDPIVVGMLHSSSKAAPFEATDDNFEKGYVSKEGIKLVFDDEKKSVSIETPAGKKIVLDEDEGAIKLEDENNNKLIMDSEGIVIESGGKLELKSSQDLKVEGGTNLELKAGASFKAEGSAGAELSTSAVAVLKGSLVQIN
ncbi:type IV secretion protein Rhs [Aquimarina atlantica]|uniref:Type IV secretion protein Rhs n=1 Tax=Aquimarina atlantica TaxID=1317122 RepID=A0A023BP27_9FLAO|nr:type VI secretion system tip protein VgrG [Aquimarina atlantica]EZH71840.1 type IV secretion protein Rhs [Aquimarina atlantica]